MDKDKLDKAAKQHAEKKCEQGTVSSIRCAANFKDGANWLLSQPLDDRLTADEAEKIRRAYKLAQTYYELDWESGNADGQASFWRGQMELLKEIFGTEFFTGNAPAK